MSAYQNAAGAYFIYPNLSKALPQIIHDNKFEEVPSTEEILRGLWLLASVPNSDYFLFMGYRDGKRYFSALDTQGSWHQTLPPDPLFTVVQNTGRILWPTQEHFIPDQQIPEGWMVQEIIQVRENSLYEIRIVKNQEERQGIWDNGLKQWLFAPEYYAIYPMNNKMYWRYQSEKNGLWGVKDTESKVLIEPTYHRLQPDGWVTKRHDEGSISFYLHPQTLVELREK